MSDWVKAYFADVDGMDMESFLANHTEGAVVQFGNNPPAEGKEQIRGAIGGLWQSIAGLSHTPSNIWTMGDSAVQEAVCTYRTKGGQEVAIPVTSILHREGELVDSLRIYVDMAPLFTQMAEESAESVPA